MGVLRPDAPDLIADRNARPVLALVFDREGWSPDLFERLARRGIAVITWHKRFKADRTEKCRFRKVRVPIVGPLGVSGISEFDLRHAEIKLSNGTGVRQVLRKLKCGRPVPFVTADFHMPLERVASSMFSRWRRENFSNT